MDPVAEYHETLSPESKAIATQLRTLIAAALPRAEGKVWHGHPVWFLGANPIVGYSQKKAGLELLFWSGQSFATPGLKAVGKFKAAGLHFASSAEVDVALVDKWLSEAQSIQWDYANLPKKRSLEKLTEF